jgi:integrase
MPKFKTVADAKKENGRYNAGDSLYLVVRGGSVLWEHQYREGGKLRAKSYGSAVGASPVGLTQARRLASLDALERQAARQTARNARYLGIAPANSNSAPAAATTFAVARDQYFQNMQGTATPQWTPEQFETLKRMMAKHAAPLDNRPVGAITLDDMAELLRPIWKGPGSHTGNRVRGMVEKILRSAGIKTDDNPATWENLAIKLPNKVEKSVSRAALPYADVPALMRELADNKTMQARAARFMILTATRQDETLEATWGEFDLAARVWTIPAERMKMDAPHAVPLSDAALAILGPAGAAGALVFPSKIGGRMSQHTVRELVQELRPAVAVHGFRSSFATWGQDQEDGKAYAPPVIDAALAHYKGSATTKAYQRSTLFAPRVKLMDAWSRFAAG